MNKFLIVLVSGLLSFTQQSMAQQSTITEADGESCMGLDQTKRQTEEIAMDSAKKYATEMSATHIRSETVVKNFQLESDVVEAFAEAEVKVLEVISKKWGLPLNDCFVIRIKAEVIPVQSLIPKQKIAENLNDPTLPLNVKLWTSAKTYRKGDVMKIYLEGNKGFYARLVYTDAAGNNLQLLPNAYRQKNYIDAGTRIEIPSRVDNFTLSVGEPFGSETLTLYASTVQLGSIETVPAGSVFVIKSKDIAAKTRGISIISADSANGKTGIVEFAETSTKVTTRP